MQEEEEKRLGQLCQQAAAFCAYQERTPKQVTEKLQQLTATPDEIEDVIEWLIAEKFLSVERYAQAYSNGKFRFKKWGKLKIRQGLRQSGLTDIQANTGMDEIDQAAYEQTLHALLLKKYQSLKADLTPMQKRGKLYFFAASKGYESDLIRRYIEQIMREE